MKKILSLITLLFLALNAESFSWSQKLSKSSRKPDLSESAFSAPQSFDKDFFLIYQEPTFTPSFQSDSFFDDPFFSQPLNPIMPSFWNLNYPQRQLQNPFLFDNIHSIMLQKLLNSFPSFYNAQEMQGFYNAPEMKGFNDAPEIKSVYTTPEMKVFFDGSGLKNFYNTPDMKKLETNVLNTGLLNNVKNDLVFDALSCNSVLTELNSDGDNYETNRGFMYHFESSTCNCNQTSFCKYSYTKPDLDYCYLKQIESTDSGISNCELLDKCNSDTSCDGIYVDHRSIKYFKVYCSGDRSVPNISAKSAKQFVIQLKNC